MVRDDHETRDDVDCDLPVIILDSSSNWTPSVDKSKPPDLTIKQSHGKRRSMSAGDVEVKTHMAQTSAGSSSATKADHKNKEPQVWDNRLHVIINDFKNELSQLDPGANTPLDLRDPSLVSRNSAPARSTPHNKLEGRPISSVSKRASSTPMPTVTLWLPSKMMDTELKAEGASNLTDSPTLEAPPVSHRISMLQTPARPPSGSSFASSKRLSSLHSASSGKSRTGTSASTPPARIHGHSSSRDLARLRVHHRPTASSSEPSLVPTGDGARAREPDYSFELGVLMRMIDF